MITLSDKVFLLMNGVVVSRMKYRVALGLVLAAAALTTSGCTLPSLSCTGGLTGINCTL
jgi:hypothetical protein